MGRGMRETQSFRLGGRQERYKKMTMRPGGSLGGEQGGNGHPDNLGRGETEGAPAKVGNEKREDTHGAPGLGCENNKQGDGRV